MRPHYKMLLVVSATCAISSCKDYVTEIHDETEMQPITILATLESDTKTTLDGHAVVWEAGDQVAISTKGYSGLGVLDIVPEDVGKTTARFTGYGYSTGDYALLYPYSIAAYTYNTNSFYVTVPATQSYRKDSFGKGANIAVASISDLSQTAHFYNTGGLLKLTIKGSVSVRKIELNSLLSSEFLSGTAYLSKNYSINPATTFGYPESSSSQITLDCSSSGVALNSDGVDFYFYVPIGTLGSGFQVTVYDTDGGKMFVQAPSSSKNKIVRNQITAMPPITYVDSNLPTLFMEKKVLGVYNNCKTDPSLKTAYLTGKVQAGVSVSGSNQIFSLKNWDDEWIVTFTMPSTLVPGAEYDVSVNPVTGTGSGFSSSTLKLKFIMAKDGFGWFMDESNGSGYIFNVL